jgi:hypothetical protein
VVPRKTFRPLVAKGFFIVEVVPIVAEEALPVRGGTRFYEERFRNGGAKRENGSD